MKKVVLLNPPYSRPIMRDTFHPTSKSALYMWHPLDLLIQSGYLSDCDVRIFDGVVDGRPGAVEALLDDFRPDGVLSLVSYPTLQTDMDLLRRIRERHDPVLFAVGDVTYGMKEEFLERFPFVDGVLSDFTSRAFGQFLRGDEVRNAAWRSDGAIRTEWTHEPIDYGRPRHDLLDLPRYYLPYWKPPFGSVYATHGCPAKCRFCVAPGWGKPRSREHDAILDELSFLRTLGVSKVFFRDGSFNQSPPYMLPLCEQIARRFPGARLTTWFKPRPLSDEMAATMRAAGFRFVHVGVETGSPEFLRRLGKDFRLEEVAPGVETLHRHGIKVVGHFMIGLPDETENDLRLTARYLGRTKLDVVSFSVFEFSYGITIRKDANGGPPADDRRLRRRLVRLLLHFYLRPGRWPKIYFWESAGHLLQSIPRILKYLFDLRLYPRFASLGERSPRR